MLTENGGRQIVDCAGSSNGVLEAGPTWAPGVGGPVVKFDTSHKISVPAVGPLKITGAITVEALAYYAGSTAGQGFAELTNGGASGTSYLMFLQDNPTHAYFRIHVGGGSLEAITTVALGIGWNHIVGTYTGATVNIYVNGILMKSTAATGTQDTATGPLVIGSVGGGGYPYQERISHIRIWNRALNSQDVQQLYADPHGMFA